MTTPQHILDIAQARLQEATVLYNNGLCDGAFYLAGYSIELALKAKICILLDIPNLFDDSFRVSLKNKDILKNFKTHNLDDLILLSGNRAKFQLAKSNDVNLYNNWGLITEKWSENCRYMCCGTKNPTETNRLIEAISHTTSGVLTWILAN